MTSEYALSKHRFYELKHFCLQYPEWIKEYYEADGWKGNGDTTSKDGIRRADIQSYISLIEFCVNTVNPALFPYITGVRKTVPTELKYDYKRFFWELSRIR